MNTDHLFDKQDLPPTAETRDFAIFIAKWAFFFAFSFIAVSILLGYGYEHGVHFIGPIIILMAYIVGFSYLVSQQAIDTLDYDFDEKWWALLALLFAVFVGGHGVFSILLDAKTMLPDAIADLLPSVLPFSLINALQSAVRYMTIAVVLLHKIKRTRD